MFQQHEKFWAFTFLLAVIAAIMLSVIAIGRAGAEPIVGLADKVLSGLTGVLGAAAALLFRSSSAENDTASALKTMASNATPADRPKGTQDDPIATEEVK